MSNQRTLVLDQNKQPLMPCHPARARELLRKGKAAVWRRFPFTIILKERTGGETQSVQIKVDPGSKATGIALVGDFKRGQKVLWGANLIHRGLAIKKDLKDRSDRRGSRRGRQLRYRKARFLNRRRPAGWLAPSLMHRVLTTVSWVTRLSRWTPADQLSMELVRFDMQQLENPEISGTEYQQGELFGFEVKGYLLAKWEHKCAYCGKGDTPLEVEHVFPRSKGGSDRVSNLTVACVPCNQRKGSKSIEEFLKGKPDVLKRVQAQLKAPLRDAAAVNSTRKKLHEALQDFGFPVEVGTGGRTKWNRKLNRLPKDHWTDAACVGESGERLRVPSITALRITCKGRGSRQMMNPDRYGFPQKSGGHRKRRKVYFGYQTGDIVRANVPKKTKQGKDSKHPGVHIGRISVRARRSFGLKGFDVNLDHLIRLQRMDGYDYAFEQR